jgi:hypothetical protein
LDFNVVLACNVTCAFELMTGIARTQRVLFEKHGRGVVVVARLQEYMHLTCNSAVGSRQGQARQSSSP